MDVSPKQFKVLILKLLLSKTLLAQSVTAFLIPSPLRNKILLHYPNKFSWILLMNKYCKSIDLFLTSPLLISISQNILACLQDRDRTSKHGRPMIICWTICLSFIWWSVKSTPPGGWMILLVTVRWSPWRGSRKNPAKREFGVFLELLLWTPERNEQVLQPKRTGWGTI